MKNTELLPAALSRRDAARYLSLSTRMLDKLAANGEITRRKCGAKTLYARCDLDQWLMQRGANDAK